MIGNRKKRKRHRASGRDGMFREAFLPERKTVRRKEAAPAHRFPWWVASLWAVFFGVIAYVLLFSPFQMLEHCEVSGNRDVPADRIRGFVREEWSRPVWYVLPGNGFLILRPDEMEEGLLRRFPKLSSVEVAKVFPDGISVSVTERDRIPVFCSGDDCFLVNGDGIATDASAALLEENAPFVTRLEDSSGTSVSEGDILFDPTLPETVFRLVDGLRDIGLSVEAPVTMPARVSGELRFRTEAGWEVYASVSVAPEKTVETLRLVLEREVPEERQEKLRYIDLRTENRAYLAFHEEEKEGGDEMSEGDDGETGRESVDETDDE